MKTTISHDELVDLLDGMCDLYSIENVPIVFNKNRCFGEGHCEDVLGSDGKHNYSVEIGIEGVKTMEDRLKPMDNQEVILRRMGVYKELSDPISVGKAIAPIVALGHEVSGHLHHMMRDANTERLSARVILLNYYGTQDSGLYYGNDGHIDANGYVSLRQYFNQPCEIAAQYAGIKMSYDYLSNAYDADTANFMLCEYHKYRVSQRAMCDGMKKSYDSVDDMLNDYNEAFRTQIFKHKEYAVNYNCDDIVHRYDVVHGTNCVRLVSKTKSGLMQDYIMAALYMNVTDAEALKRGADSEDLLCKKRVFGDMDFDLKHVLKRFNSKISKKLESECKTNSVSLHDFDIEFSKPADSNDFEF